jgi:uncharacterized membrane protein
MSDNTFSRWDWIAKNYRVWEANLKVFLYPENWMEPEMRQKTLAIFLVILVIITGIIFSITNHRSKMSVKMGFNPFSRNDWEKSAR